MKLLEGHEVRRAGNKGYGLFAVTTFDPGQVVINVVGQMVTDRDINTPLFDSFSEISYKIDDDHHISPSVLDKDKLAGIFAVNHSCDLNSGMKGNLTVVARKQIVTGQEITIDYCMVDADVENMECLPTLPIACLCGSPECRKVINGFDWRNKDLQERYRGYFSDYVQSRIKRLNSFSRNNQPH